MPDENDLVLALGKLQGQLEIFIETQTEINKNQKEVLQTCREFHVYQQGTCDHPDRLQNLEKKTEVYDNIIKQRDEKDDIRDKKLDFLFKQFNYAIGIFVAVNAILVAAWILYAAGLIHFGKL